MERVIPNSDEIKVILMETMQQPGLNVVHRIIYFVVFFQRLPPH